MTALPVVIIGAGPAGLAIAGQLRRLSVPFVVLEKGTHVAQSWHNHYKRLHLHTVRDLSHLPDAPFPTDYPQYVPKDQLIAYYERYAAEHDIRPLFDKTVDDLEKMGDTWKVTCTDGSTFTAQHVVLCAGMNRVPFRPHYQNEEDFVGELLHSSAYKDPTPYIGKRVLVVGMGNSGAEIALDLCEHNVDTSISVRGPVNIVPHEFLGTPTQVTALKLAQLPTWIGDTLGMLVRKITVGDLPKYGIELPEMSPARQLRETGQTPVIDLGTVDRIRSGQLKVLPGIEEFTNEGVLFAHGEEAHFDAVIFATGFRAQISDWLTLDKIHFDERGLPRQVIGAGEWEGLYFLGYNNYAPGGGLGIIRQDVRQVAESVNDSRK